MEFSHIEQDTLVPVVDKTGPREYISIPKTENDQEVNQTNQSPTSLPFDEYQLTKNKKRRQIRPFTRFDNDNYVSLFTYQGQFENESMSYKDAIKCKESKNWMAIMEDKKSSFLKNKTWDLVIRPKG